MAKPEKAHGQTHAKAGGALKLGFSEGDRACLRGGAPGTQSETIMAPSSAVRRRKSASCVAERPTVSAAPSTSGPGALKVPRPAESFRRRLFSPHHTPKRQIKGDKHAYRAQRAGNGVHAVLRVQLNNGTYKSCDGCCRAHTHTREARRG